MCYFLLKGNDYFVYIHTPIKSNAFNENRLTMNKFIKEMLYNGNLSTGFTLPQTKAITIGRVGSVGIIAYFIWRIQSFLITFCMHGYYVIGATTPAIIK